jgi:hypothetical protein
MGVHVNNAGEFPVLLTVFSLGVKEPAYDPSPRVAGAPFLNLSETAELPALTNAVDLSEYRKLLVQRPRSTQDERGIWWRWPSQAAQAVW